MLQEITRGLRSCKGLHGVTGTYKGLQLFVVGYKELLGLQEAKGCSKGHKRLH